MQLVSKTTLSGISFTLALLASFGGAFSCSDSADDDSSADSDADGDADGDTDTDADGDAEEGQYLIEAYMGGPLSLDGFTVYVGRVFDTDPSAEGATITINGTQVALRPLISDDADAVYYAAGVGYEPDASFDVQMSLAGKSASCAFTAPGGTDVNFDPDDDITLTAGDPLELAWVFAGGTPEKLHLTVANSDSTSTPVDEDLDPTATSYTVPGSDTASWSAGTSYVASIDLGEYLYPFTGTLASPSSVTTLVLPGSAITVFMAE
jgi:hypothetical protein